MKPIPLILFGWAVASATAAEAPLPAKIDYNRDIRPILSENCYACHGPDTKKLKADLRLDQREIAIKPNKDGHAAIVPKQSAKSLLVQRITTKDADDLMPPLKTNKKLSSREIALLKQWIAQGAEYQTHWAYVPPAKVKPPTVTAAGFVQNGIDRFVLAKLQEQKLKPSPEASRVALSRRLSFDLTGLPPAPAETEAFANDKSPQAYEKLVDQLLASPRFGERMAMHWFDLVRYADTRGYHGDQHQHITPYRDYVINAFNNNLPYDRFTAEQLAGDLLPDATQAQKVASGYNRLLMTTEEGGAQAKEYTAKYASDRVRNASVVWLGSTLGCTECHDHKYDPFQQRDFYSFAAFFADVKETAVGGLETVQLPTPDQQQKLAELDKQLAAVDQEIRAALAQTKYEEPPLAPETKAPEGADPKAAPAKPDLSSDSQRAWETKVAADAKTAVPKPIVDLLKVATEQRTEPQRKLIRDHYIEFVWRGSRATFDPLHKKLAAAKSSRVETEKEFVRTMVSTAVAPRMVRILPRGNWLDDSGEAMQPAIPVSLGKIDTKERRANRLDLAQWLTSKENPLTARVFVNRMWKLMYGRGLVTTLEDFGRQGQHPSHPELLDWLANEFVDSGWNVKHIMKLIAMSGTYRQTSLDSVSLRLKDPYNSLLARQGRYRLDAEMVRDNALAVSGLLVHKMGGPSARQYQPAGYWSYLNFPTREWQKDAGDGLYRRGVYTYWCRTFLHPSLLAFDASTREECVAERVRSNTPQQALVLLNDPTYVEAARAFAELVLRDGGKETADRLKFAFRQALHRAPRPEEAKLLSELVSQHLKQFEADPAAAEEFLKVGDRPAAKTHSAAELAAWTNAARVLFNLHEFITRN